ncbi:YihY/virulence factor BrkB family protein [Mangrovimonas sp. AS39]|uniref:YihY/virulence factor BrkB family protein n=1 Tax=Mangrovimonas futianensis TaxID=2895523 RepID=UPI001E546FC3|nr:YihY/virulence factor BrkB family protein [Mangrovimonas futianensis]MCF1191393.1 YihY/virulence factor BrkB family protein [Mangrovimonas futianensis]MCF1195088.1 YihY/virulence factor BrkB family protein [Mangrovimonas futianensis]
MTEQKFKFKHLPKLTAKTFKAWMASDPWRMSAVVAYYAVLSLPGLLVVIINIIGGIWGSELIRGGLINEIKSALGADAAQTIVAIVEDTQDQKKSIWSTVIGLATLIYGSTGVFYQLQISLNKLWRVESTKKHFKNQIWELITDRARSFAFILVIGFLLLISFALTAVLSATTDYLGTLFPDLVVYLAYGLDGILSSAIIFLLFGLMFRYMPDRKIEWKNVWIGAFFTAVLFVLGQFLLGLYFGKSDPGSTYGAAGGLVLVLLWASYASLIFFFGAQFTKLYADTYGLKENENESLLKINVVE